MNAASKITIAIALGAFAALACPSARAQAEVAPDHFDAPDMVPFDSAKPTAAAVRTADVQRNVQYSGRVMLAHRVRVNGKNLAPGNYAVSLHSDGKTVELRLDRRGETVAMQSAAYRNVPATSRGYLVVERRGNARRVSVIHAGSLQLVFAPEQGAAEVNSAATLEVLPLPFIATES